MHCVEGAMCAEDYVPVTLDCTLEPPVSDRARCQAYVVACKRSAYNTLDYRRSKFET